MIDISAKELNKKYLTILEVGGAYGMRFADFSIIAMSLLFKMCLLLRTAYMKHLSLVRLQRLPAPANKIPKTIIGYSHASYAATAVPTF